MKLATFFFNGGCDCSGSLIQSVLSRGMFFTLIKLKLLRLWLVTDLLASSKNGDSSPRTLFTKASTTLAGQCKCESPGNYLSSDCLTWAAVISWPVIGWAAVVIKRKAPSLLCVVVFRFLQKASHCSMAPGISFSFRLNEIKSKISLVFTWGRILRVISMRKV